MNKQYKKSIFIFRRDLRLEDNTALINALNLSVEVIPCFIFDPNQIERNEYKSSNSLQFLIESLKDLEEQLKKKKSKLYLFYGEPEKIIEQLVKKENISAVFLNKDYTPFSLQRDLKIEMICKNNGVAFEQSFDLLLNDINIFNSSGKPYQIFTSFYKVSSLIPIQIPAFSKLSNLYTDEIDIEQKALYKRILKNTNNSLAIHGGRKNCLQLLSKLKNYARYQEERDYPFIDKTTHLSPHLKYGNYSVREIFYLIIETFGKNHSLLRQLYWRDFFTHIAFHFPHVFGKPFYKKYEGLKWKNNKVQFQNWCEGLTGFPIVDAGMRELNTTGFMHNRVRMIVASFLTKDLHIDWRWGEKYFAQKLIDYDPSVNNGNWQWAASTGCDAQPYFRIFNPWLQQKRFDFNCKYIKKWIPELNNLTSNQIHKLEIQKPIQKIDYPTPIVNHSVESKLAKEIFLTKKVPYRE